MMDSSKFEEHPQHGRGGKQKRVILWGREDVLGQAVELFLSARPEWEVIRLYDEKYIDALLEAIESVNPEVVLIYQGDTADDERLPLLLLHERPWLKVITVSLENNSMEVYNKQKVWVKEVADLFSVVES